MTRKPTLLTFGVALVGLVASCASQYPYASGTRPGQQAGGQTELVAPNVPMPEQDPTFPSTCDYPDMRAKAPNGDLRSPFLSLTNFNPDQVDPAGPQNPKPTPAQIAESECLFAQLSVWCREKVDEGSGFDVNERCVKIYYLLARYCGWVNTVDSSDDANPEMEIEDPQTHAKIKIRATSAQMCLQMPSTIEKFRLWGQLNLEQIRTFESKNPANIPTRGGKPLPWEKDPSLR